VNIRNIIRNNMAAIPQTFSEIVALDSPSGHEEKVAQYIGTRLTRMGVSIRKDIKGNIIGFIQGKGEPLLLCAHMDRVPPGKGNHPIIEKSIAVSDGSTNLGADDAAGITVILESLEKILSKKLPHPPLVVVFTVEEEIGLLGARAVDLSSFSVHRGIVIDNAFETGVVVSGGAAIYSFEIIIEGKEVHSGKEPEAGINAFVPFWKVKFPLGTTDEGKTRINIGIINAGTAINVVPGHLYAKGEIRSFLTDSDIEEKLKNIEQVLKNETDIVHARLVFRTQKLASSYSVHLDHPVVLTYKRVLKEQGYPFVAKDTFIGSDTQIFVCEKKLDAFTLSTGVANEHSVRESINLIELEMLKDNLVRTISYL
jgi:tripeptide aminopeptidase